MTTTNERDDLLEACAMEEARHCDPIKVAAWAVREDYALYCEVGDLIASGVDNAYETIIQERAAPAESFGRLFRGSIGSLLSTGEHSAAVVAFFDRHDIRA